MLNAITIKVLINCNLSYREIMKNLPEIRKIFEKVSGGVRQNVVS